VICRSSSSYHHHHRHRHHRTNSETRSDNTERDVAAAWPGSQPLKQRCQWITAAWMLAEHLLSVLHVSEQFITLRFTALHSLYMECIYCKSSSMLNSC